MNPDANQMHSIIAAIIGFYMVFFVVLMAIVILPFWFILKKAGFSPWLSLINVVPLGTLILLYIVAFGEWRVIPVPPVAWQPPYPPYPPQPPLPPQA
jgi:RsiW-degrading membrane proteinase PrsW (M82 family)